MTDDEKLSEVMAMSEAFNRRLDQDIQDALRAAGDYKERGEE